MLLFRGSCFSYTASRFLISFAAVEFIPLHKTVALVPLYVINALSLSWQEDRYSIVSTFRILDAEQRHFSMTRSFCHPEMFLLRVSDFVSEATAEILLLFS